MRRNLIVSAVALLAGLLLGLIWMREPTVPLTMANLTAAKERWHDNGPSSYRLDYRMNRDIYQVTVDNGIVIEATVNGHTPRMDDLRAYSMEGLFDLLQTELENIADPAGPFSGRAETVMARVRFHSVDGHVERYIRNSAGVARGAEVHVLQFHAQEADSLSRPKFRP